MSPKRAETAVEALMSTRGALCRAPTRPQPRLVARKPVVQRPRWIYTSDGSGGLVRENAVIGRDMKERTAPAAHLPRHPRVAVLGAGLTGLTTAYYLAQELPPKSKVVLYEADTRAGGWVRSEKVPVEYNGEKREILFERGPRMASMSEMGGRLDRMIMYDLILNHALVPRDIRKAKSRWIWYDGRLTPLPPYSRFSEIFENSLLWQITPVALFNYICRVLLGMGGPLPSDDMSVADWIQDVFGSQPLADTFISAALHGVWGGDVYQLSAVSAFGPLFHSVRDKAPPAALMRVPTREFRFMQNFATPRPDVLSMWRTTSAAVVNFGHHGLEALPQAIANTLVSSPDVDVRMGTPVKSLTYNRSQDAVMVKDDKGGLSAYDKVISTLPAHQLAKLTGTKLPTLSTFPSVSIMTVNIWYPFEDIVPDGLGYLIPGSTPYEENPERALGVFFDSQVGIGSTRSSDHPVTYTNEPGTKLFVLMGGHYYDDVQPPTEAQAIDQAKALLERHLRIPRDTPCHATARLAQQCLPQHTVGHSSRVSQLASELQDSYGNRLATVGGSFTKPGVTGALRAGWDIVDDVVNYDFLSNGLEDAGENVALHPSFVDVPKHGVFGTSGMRRNTRRRPRKE